MKSIKTKLLLSVGIVVLASSMIFLYHIYATAKYDVENTIHQQLSLALHFDLAIRDYVAKKVRPLMYDLIGEDEFIPETMSTSFVGRNIFKSVREKFPDYIIKFSAENPRNPSNEAGPQELRMIRYFSDNPTERIWTGEVEMGGKKYLAKFSAMRVSEECLRCHGDPRDAPAELVEIYGSEGGFNHKPGGVAGMDTIAIPTDKIYALLRAETASNFLVMGFGLIFLFVSLALVLRFVVTDRITRIANHFAIAGEEMEGARIEPVEVEGEDEIAVMAASFNRLAAKLGDLYSGLEAKVAERTRELSEANEMLTREIEEHRITGRALRESEEKYRSIFENIIDVYYRSDMEGNLVLASPSGPELLGYDTVEEMVGKNIAEVFYYDPTERDKLIERLKEHGEIRGFTVTLRRKDGTAIIVETNSHYVYDDEGNPIAVEGIFRDITERKQAEEALRESEERFRYLAEASFEAILIHADGVLIDANEQYFRMFGYKSHELLGKQAIPLTVAPESLEFLMSQVRSGIVEPYEAVGMRKDGTRFLMELHARQMQYQGRNVRVAAIRDITSARKAQEALRESEEKYRLIFEKSPAGIMHFDKDGVITDCNDKFAEIIGAPKERLVGFNMIESMRDEPARWAVEETIRTGVGHFEGEYVTVTGGREIFIDANHRAITDENGNFLGAVGIFEDITERKRGEEALRDSEERYRALFDGANEGILLADVETREFSYANPAMCEMLSYTEDELTRMRIDDIHPGEVLDNVISEFDGLVQQKISKAEDIVCLKRDGTTFVADISGAKVSIGGKLFMAGFFSDITERKEAEKALRESEERYRTLVSNIPGAVYRLARDQDQNWTCRFVSEEIEDISGYPASDFLDNRVRTCLSIVHPDDREAVLKAERESVGNRKPYENECRVIRADGSLGWIYDKGQGIFDDDENLLWLDGVLFDITEKKLAEEKLMHYQQQLRAMASEMSLIEERERRRIALDLHDGIGQALAISRIKLGELKHSASDETLAGSLGEISNLIEQTIEDTRSLIFELSPPVLYELGFEAAVEWLVEQFEKNSNLTCHLDIDKKPATLNDDIGMLLFQAVRELLHNVVKHAKTRRASVSVHKDDGLIRIEVADNGAGFDPASVQAASDGGGFGLFSIRERLKTLGGRVDIRSEPGQGTRVTLFAPLAANA